MSEKDAKNLIQRMTKYVGFDSFQIVKLNYPRNEVYGLALINDDVPNFVVTSPDHAGNYHDIFRFKSLNKDIHYIDCLRALLGINQYVMILNYNNFNCSKIFIYPNETLESLMIRLDLNGE